MPLSSEFEINQLTIAYELAEAQGRVFWRIPEPSSLVSARNVQRFRNTLQKAREMGANIPEWDYHSRHYDAYWNIPAMREFLGNSVTYANRV